MIDQADQNDENCPICNKPILPGQANTFYKGIRIHLGECYHRAMEEGLI